MLAYTSWVHKYNGNIDYLSPRVHNRLWTLALTHIFKFKFGYCMAKKFDSLKFYILIIKILIIYYATDIISRYYNNYDLITAIIYRSGVSSFSS